MIKIIDISGHLREIKQECGFEKNDEFLVINCCGYQKFISKDFSRNRENGRLDFQIIYIYKGAGDFYLDGKTIKVGEGNIVIYKPREKQRYRYYFNDNTEVYWVHFTGYGVEPFLADINFLDHHSLFVGFDNKFIELFKSIISELQLKQPVYKYHTHGLLIELISCMSRKHQYHLLKDNDAKEKWLQAVLGKMHTAYNEKWTVAVFAKECNMSQYWFIKSFKRYVGIPPIQYLLNIRIEKAREFLVDSDLSISQISDIIGYNNPLYFSRIFKKSTGMSPTDYRKINS